MKKLSALVLICCTAVILSACSVFHNDTTQTYPQDEPYTATVFLKLNDGVIFAPELLTNWKADIERIITENADSTTTKITAVNCDTTLVANLNAYPVELTLSNVPAATTRKVVRPFKIYYTQTIYNPITLLPANENFTYVIGYNFERRQSKANTDIISQDEDGSYTYLWTTGTMIEVENVYPNRPLYYVLIMAGAIVVGVVVYCIWRYIDCKKRNMSL